MNWHLTLKQLYGLVAAVPFVGFVTSTYGEQIETAVVVKSFIRKIDTSSVLECSGNMERLFAGLTNCQYAEDPKTPHANTSDFRLFSRMPLQAQCDSAGNISTWRFEPPTAQFGREGWILSAEGDFGRRLTAIPGTTGTNAKTVSFDYLLKGRPNALTKPAFLLVRARSCDYIWHHVQGVLSCSGSKPQVAVTLTGSKFPSHRAWVGDVQKQNLDQGPLSNLWSCDKDDATLVQ